MIESYGEKRQGAQLDKAGKVFLGPAKLFADGSPQGYTAWFSKPYFKQLPGKPADFRGFPVFNSQEELFALVQKLHDAGWQITTHTNGDQAIQDMIDLTEVSEKENAAETLLMAKGFSDPVVSITKDKVDVVINAPSITDPQRAQIEDIVKRKAEVGADQIIITLLNMAE